MKFILGEKLHMTQIFDSKGNVQPVTALKAGPIVVTQIKTKSKDGYDATQVGFGTKSLKNINKALKGHLKDASFRFLREFQNGEAKNVGDSIDVGIFEAGDTVTVASISKGKGFQGVVKRHGFRGGPRSHGQKHSEREPGSISHGLRTGPRKGLRMAGRMGGDRVQVKNLKVIEVFPSENLIFIKGAIPGRRGTLVEIKGK
jgi:large subunit ribosomal protein L3